MIDQSPAGSSFLFKGAALLLLAAIAVAVTAFAKRSKRADRAREWMGQDGNVQSLLFWLSVALILGVFGGLGIFYELTH